MLMQKYNFLYALRDYDVINSLNFVRCCLNLLIRYDLQCYGRETEVGRPKPGEFCLMLAGKSENN